MKLPLRTHATSLSDDQLLLLDFFFDKRASAGFLTATQYKWHMNVLYTHGLSNIALEATLDDFVARGLLRSDREVDKAILSLTPAGGRLWEAERNPDWCLYVCDLHDYRDDDSNFVSFISPDQGTLRRFYTVAVDCGLVTPLEHPKEDWTADPEFIPWKSFGRLARIRFSAAITETLSTDWGIYESRRTWWRSIRELDTLARGVGFD